MRRVQLLSWLVGASTFAAGACSMDDMGMPGGLGGQSSSPSSSGSGSSGTLSASTSSSSSTGGLPGCTEMVSATDDLAARIDAADDGAVLCLASGDYGEVDIADIHKNADVTVISAPGASVSMYANLNRASHLRFAGLTLATYLTDSADITFDHDTFDGMSRVDTTVATPNAHILFDSNTFDGITAGPDDYEGRLTIRGFDNTEDVGVTLSNNHFGGGGGSDGIQIVGGAYGVVIGPGNEFTGLCQCGQSAHVDPIQLYGSSHTQIVGNYFHDNGDGSGGIMAPDGGDHEIISGNVFVVDQYPPMIQLGSHTASEITHNTFVGNDVHIDHKTGSDPSTDGVVRDNVFVAPSGLSADPLAVEDYNLFGGGGGEGLHDIEGVAVFVGGSNPATYADFHLTASSPGHLAASDGTDIGIP